AQSSPGMIWCPGKPHLLDRIVVLVLRHEGTRQASMALLPLRMLAIEFLHLRNGWFKFSLIAICMPEFVSHRSLIGRNPLGLAIFRHSLSKIAFLVPEQTQIRVRFPKTWP